MAKNISNYMSNTLLSGTNGNDTIYNDYGGSNVTINAIKGNDSIYNSDDSVTINGGAVRIQFSTTVPT